MLKQNENLGSEAAELGNVPDENTCAGRPPLVTPIAQLTRSQQERYARQLSLPQIGVIGQRRLVAAKVLVIGAGGLGAPVLQYLGAGGVGTIGIIDDDLVDLSNLQRQVIHNSDRIGQPKTTSAKETLHALNPEINVIEHRERLTAANAETIIGQYDLVLDGADNFPTRYLVDDTCTKLGKPAVWGSIFRFDGQVSVFWAGAAGRFGDTKLPQELGLPATWPAFGSFGRGPRLRDVFPTPPAPGTVPSCAEAGVMGALCGQVGSYMALEAIKLITGIGSLSLGQVAVIDSLSGTVSHIPFVPSYVDEGEDHAVKLVLADLGLAGRVGIGPWFFVFLIGCDS